MWLPIFIMTLGTVTIGTELFGVPGILTTIAEEFDVSMGTAGQLVTFSSMGYAIGSPLLVTLTATVARRRVLILCMLAYAVAALLAALASNFLGLTIARVAAAITSGLFLPVAAAVAANLAGDARRGRALAIVQSGTAGAVAIGVPLCIWITAFAGWRLVYIVIAAVALLTTIAIVVVLGSVTSPPPPPLRERLKLLGEGQVIVALVVTVLWMAAGFVVYTYIRPVLATMADVSGQGLSGLIFAYGAGGIAGSIIGGLLVDRLGATIALILSLAMLGLNFLFMPVTAISAAGAALFMLLWGHCRLGRRASSTSYSGSESTRPALSGPRLERIGHLHRHCPWRSDRGRNDRDGGGWGAGCGRERVRLERPDACCGADPLLKMITECGAVPKSMSQLVATFGARCYPILLRRQFTGTPRRSPGLRRSPLSSRKSAALSGLSKPSR